MKKLLYYIFLIFVFFSCRKDRISYIYSIDGYEKFAELRNDTYNITTDSISFKAKLVELFDTKKQVSIDKIEIVKQQTLGDNKSDFYYILAHDLTKDIRIARYLVRINDFFYINNNIKSEDLFEQTYLICIGGGNCNPQVFDMESGMSWSCSDIYECTYDKFMDCKMFTTVSIEDK